MSAKCRVAVPGGAATPPWLSPCGRAGMRAECWSRKPALVPSLCPICGAFPERSSAGLRTGRIKCLMSSAWGWDGLEQGGYGRGRGRGGRGRSRGRGRGRGRTGALGGAEGRREVLERARAEREARAHERQRQRAATKIQGTVRRYQAERRVGMQWWEMLDTKLEGLARLRGRGGQSPLVPWPLLASLLRLFGQAVLLRARVGKLDCSGVATCANRLSALLAANMADTGPTSVTSVFQHRSPAALSQWTMVVRRAYPSPLARVAALTGALGLAAGCLDAPRLRRCSAGGGRRRSGEGDGLAAGLLPPQAGPAPPGRQ